MPTERGVRNRSRRVNDVSGRMRHDRRASPNLRARFLTPYRGPTIERPAGAECHRICVQLSWHPATPGYARAEASHSSRDSTV